MIHDKIIDGVCTRCGTPVTGLWVVTHARGCGRANALDAFPDEGAPIHVRCDEDGGCDGERGAA